MNAIRTHVLRRALVAVMVAAGISGSVRAGDDAPPDARDLVKRVLDAAPAVPFTAKATLTSDRGWVRELDLSHARIDGVDTTYMEVTAPLDLKDTRFLLFDHQEGKDEQFIYVPNVKRAMQVSNETRKQPFLGSDFYISDMVRPELGAYTYRVVGTEEVSGRHCTLVEAVPTHPEGELYGKTISAIDPADLVVLRTQFFDPAGKPLKVWTVEKLERVDGIWTALSQQMKSVPDDHWSRIVLRDVHYNAELQGDVFSRTYLKR